MLLRQVHTLKEESSGLLTCGGGSKLSLWHRQTDRQTHTPGLEVSSFSDTYTHTHTHARPGGKLSPCGVHLCTYSHPYLAIRYIQYHCEPFSFSFSEMISPEHLLQTHPVLLSSLNWLHVLSNKSGTFVLSTQIHFTFFRLLPYHSRLKTSGTKKGD